MKNVRVYSNKLKINRLYPREIFNYKTVTKMSFKYTSIKTNENNFNKKCFRVVNSNDKSLKIFNYLSGAKLVRTNYRMVEELRKPSRNTQGYYEF